RCPQAQRQCHQDRRGAFGTTPSDQPQTISPANPPTSIQPQRAMSSDEHLFSAKFLVFLQITIYTPLRSTAFHPHSPLHFPVRCTFVGLTGRGNYSRTEFLGPAVTSYLTRKFGHSF